MRVLVAENDSELREAYRRCLNPGNRAPGDIPFVPTAAWPQRRAGPRNGFVSSWAALDFVGQGDATVNAVAAAQQADQPYATLLLGMHSATGIDGFETARRVRALDPDINIVLVSSLDDSTSRDVGELAGPYDRLFLISSPFDDDHLRALCSALCARWVTARDFRRNRLTLEQRIGELERDNQELVASEARYRYVALHDTLTRLPNRAAFQHHLDEMLHDDLRRVAVMFIDLDRFKHVNDNLGHPAGDELIRRLTERYTMRLPEDAMLARLGGDEFGIVLTDLDEAACLAVGKGLVQASVEDVALLGVQVQVGASIGLAMRGTHSIGCAELLRRADVALYVAKGDGRNCCRAYEPVYDESVRERNKIERRLREAILHDRLTLAYQPIVDPMRAEPVGYEALLRWEDPEIGQISPGIFVPVAEETGQILALGEWVIRNAVRECAGWPNGFVSVNISTRHFQSPGMVDFLVSEVAGRGVSPDRIQLEITERALGDDVELAVARLRELRRQGFRIALDDFGSGYTSLSNLKNFEIDCIKIDKSFVAGLGKDPNAAGIFRAMAGLARTLRLRVVAEGVETEAQVQALRLTGCELMQGYYFGAAVAPAALFAGTNDDCDRAVA